MNATLAEHAKVGRISVKLRTVSQLFHTLDASPFRERDLAKEAEQYIVDQAEELPSDVQIDIVLLLPVEEFSRSVAPEIASAVREHFSLLSRNTSREMRELFRTGRLSLLVGFVILSICLLLGLFFAQNLGEGPLPEILRETFLILGWVAIWKPSDIFLYAWPPIAWRRALLRRLASANVIVEMSRSG
ncbi:MAG: hypothetical protein ACXWKP_08595 [Bradyrhizobium sp.]